jgi:hypothetical protein
MKHATLLAAMLLLLPTLAMAQTAVVDPSLRKVPVSKQTIGFSSGPIVGGNVETAFQPGVSGGQTTYMLTGAPANPLFFRRERTVCRPNISRLRDV